MCIPSSEPLDVLPGLDRARGSHGVPFFILSPWSVLSVRLPVRVLSFTNSIAALLVHCTLSQPTFLLRAHCQWKVYPEKDKSLPCLSDFWLLLSPRRSPGSAFPPAAVAAGCVSSALGQAPGANSESPARSTARRRFPRRRGQLLRGGGTQGWGKIPATASTTPAPGGRCWRRDPSRPKVSALRSVARRSRHAGTFPRGIAACVGARGGPSVPCLSAWVSSCAVTFPLLACHRVALGRVSSVHWGAGTAPSGAGGWEGTCPAQVQHSPGPSS